MYIVGYNTYSCPEAPSSAPLMADESNQIENGAATPGNMPDITADDNHGANFRNVLYLDGHVVGLKERDAANAIFDSLRVPERLQSVD
jgi:prepilin-type processing-associated H-X9-DG protein